MQEDEENYSEEETTEEEYTEDEIPEEVMPEIIEQEPIGNIPQEYDNSLEFESHLINPASEKTHEWLNRDAVLSNLKENEVFEVKAGLELVKLLDHLQLFDARDAFLADIEATLVVSRGREGFWTKMMRTSISELKGYRNNPDEKKKDSGWKHSFRK